MGAVDPRLAALTRFGAARREMVAAARALIAEGGLDQNSLTLELDGAALALWQLGDLAALDAGGGQ